MNLVTIGCIVIGAIFLASLAVFALGIITAIEKPECPICGESENLKENVHRGLSCSFCGHRWRRQPR